VAKSADMLYLRPNIVAEPLVDRWYAWSYLIPPATAARHTTETHLRIMDSYIAAPEAHAEATKNSNLLGGPFMDYEGNRVEEIKALRQKTITERSHLLQLSTAIQDLDRMLQSEADGHSLEALYGKVPDALKGYVELVYDLNGRPNFRFHEALLYRSPYYDRASQSFSLYSIDSDHRPFIFSTPRLDDEGHVNLDLAFDDPRVNALFTLRRQPARMSKIRDVFDGSKACDAMTEALFTSQAPLPCERYSGSGVRLRYFGHACVLLETQRCSILTDPVISYRYETTLKRYGYDDLPDTIDYVLLTHNHQDHVMFETLLQLRNRIRRIIVPSSSSGCLQDPSLKLILKHSGFKNVIEATEMEEVETEFGAITAIPFVGEHGDLDVRTKTAYLVRAGRHSILFAADSKNIEPELYKHIHREIGDVDVLFLGMECHGAPVSWIYGSLFTTRLPREMDQSRRLAGSNSTQALNLVEELRCKKVYVYAMGQEPWLNYVSSIKYTDESYPIVESNKLIGACRERGIDAERLYGSKQEILQE
jgi:L-ascorbate metabolism protein UlaG (beta-lactamase superfamily)